MRCARSLGVVLCLVLAGCGKSGSGNAASEVPQHPPKGDPASLPNVPADAGKIEAMLRERFGDAVARNLRVEVEDQGGGKRVSVLGEIPNEEFRQAIMKELEARVTDMKTENFQLELAGAIRQVFRFAANVDSSRPTAFAPDLSYVVTSAGDVYETATGRVVNRMGLPDQELISMAVSPDGKTLATGHKDAGIVLWEMPLGRNPRVLSPFVSSNHSVERVGALAFTQDGKHLVSVKSDRGEVMIWELATGKGRTIGAHIGDSESRSLDDRFLLAVSPDGKMVASASAELRSVSVWDVASRSLKMTLGDQRVVPEAMAWSHNGKLLAIARDTGERRGVAVYDVATKKDRVFAREVDETISSVAFSPDDRLLAVAYDGNGAGLWDVASQKEWAALDNNNVGGSCKVAFSADGAVLATACHNTLPHSVRLWDVSKRPGAGGPAARMPAGLGINRAYNDRMMRSIEEGIRRSHAPSEVQSIHAELLADGSIELTGKVADSDVKRWAQETAENMPVPDSVGVQGPNKVINKLEVTGRRGG